MITGYILATALSAAPPPPPKEIEVVVRADVFAVDADFHAKLVAFRRPSKRDLEEAELRYHPEKKPLPHAADDLFARLEKTKPYAAGKEIRLEPGHEGEMYSTVRSLTLLPHPDGLRLGRATAQLVRDGVRLRVRVNISPDRRFVRATFSEASDEVEGTERVTVREAATGKEAVGEIAIVQSLTASRTRDLPDGGTLLVPMQYRPPTLRAKSRWLVARVSAVIVIEAEERERRKGMLKP